MLTKFRLIWIFTLLITASLSGEATQWIKFREPTNALQSQTVVYDGDGNEVTVVYDDMKRHKADIISRCFFGFPQYYESQIDCLGGIPLAVCGATYITTSVLASFSLLSCLYLNYINTDSPRSLQILSDIFTAVLLVPVVLSLAYCAFIIGGTYLWYKLPFPKNVALHAFAPDSMSENAVKTLVAEEGFIL